jgi:membrane protein required for colicin V production
MPSYFDLALLAIVLVSALLSMVRGFTREILAIASWGAAFAAAYFFYPQLLPYLRDYIHKDALAITAAVAIIFFVTLVLVSIITVRLSDAILDSKVGPLDRTLGFIFGAARGFALGVIAFLLFNYLVPKNQPEWVASAKTRPLLQSTGDELIAMLPEHLASSIVKVIQHPKSPSDEIPADEGDNKEISPNPPVNGDTETTRTKQATTPTQTDKQKLENLLGKGNGATSAPTNKRP